MNDLAIHTSIVGAAINIAAGATSLYLWAEHRNERFLLFWAISWMVSIARWVTHAAALTYPALRPLEAFLIAVTLFYAVLGAYALSPRKPWSEARFAVGVAAILLAYSAAAALFRLPLSAGYVLFALSMLFAALCMAIAFHDGRLPGYAAGALSCIAYVVLICTLLVIRSNGVANNVAIPLCNLPLTISIVTIFHERRRRSLMASEETLQKIFDTAPTPILIVRPLTGEIERANSSAIRMLGLSPDVAICGRLEDYGIVVDAPARAAIREDLAVGGPMSGREIVIHRADGEARTIAVNGDHIPLESGDRLIFSYFDLTDLRCAEQELRESAQQLRQLYGRLATVEDDERRVLHGELHDRVGANLSALRLELDVAAAMLARGDSAGAAGHMTGAREVAAETMAMARDLMAELRPPALDDFGLVAALRAFAETHSVRLNLPIDVWGDDLSPRPSRDVEGALFRIAQEAVINAARHARPTRIVIGVDDGDDRVMLTVQDDGVGFDPEAPGRRIDHWGLKNMRERARAVGGSLEVVSAAGDGTRVTADAPCGAR